MQHSKELKAFQSAWIVDDIYEAANLWAQKTGIGPFFVTDNKEGVLVDTFYRGNPSPITSKTAIAQAGEMQIELIQPTGDRPSAYRDTVPIGRPGFHHIALWSNDLSSDIALYIEKGFDVAACGNAGGIAKFAYIDTSYVFGHMIELVEENDIIRSVFRTIADAAIEWDGADPVRSYPGG